ncbi:hypothetical protein FIBSPDRAFT_875850 [Athelia psychrophila]|uniref:Uncharacterized protein n=1 Tax=Athelia psychrophila TaxID=1759441 RepID=A0A167XG56_9AGAM|nr:hypothetical protein FIBSPDRAFT_875850 [Fibularhizoctonia sp. CBS 109695]
MVITDHCAVRSCQSAQEVYLFQSTENPARSIHTSHCCASRSTRHYVRDPTPYFTSSSLALSLHAPGSDSSLAPRGCYHRN